MQKQFLLIFETLTSIPPQHPFNIKIDLKIIFTYYKNYLLIFIFLYTKTTNRSRNAMSRRNISPAATKLKRNVNAWIRKLKDDLDKNHEVIIKHINKPLDENSTQLIFNKYKNLIKNLKNDERKKNTRLKKN